MFCPLLPFPAGFKSAVRNLPGIYLPLYASFDGRKAAGTIIHNELNKLNES
ncbi:hypothetical protein ISS30_11180 [bacterium]|nr:hypothetical protein [bacterium]